MMTIVRALLCAGYSAILITPGDFLIRPLMKKRIRFRRKNDFVDEEKEA